MVESKNVIQSNLDKRLLELTSLFEISRTFSASLNLHTILENVLRIPMGQMLINKGIILLREANDSYKVVDIKGLPRNFVDQTLQIHTPPEHTQYIQEFDQTESWISFFEKFEIELLLPLISSQDHIGIIGFGPKISGEQLTEDEIEFLDTLSNMAATSIANGQMVEEIQHINRNLDRKIQQLNTIFDISSELNITLDVKKIANLLGFAVMGELLVNKYMVYLKNGEEALISSKGIKNKPDLIPDLFEITEPCLLEDTDRFDVFKELGLAMLVPMRLHEETKGALLIGSKISGGGFDETELDFLKTLGNQAITAIENARLFQEMLDKQRMEEELNLARQIQENLLPAEIPIISGYDVAAMNVSSREVGGDYYDIISISENKWAITIGDVSGKGAGAALLMASLHASIRALAGNSQPIDQMITRINDLFYQSTDLDKFITFFYGILDIKNHNFTYCNAGHNFPILLRSTGNIEHLSTGGLVLGMMPNVKYDVQTIPIHPGDKLCFYTDGITEAVNKKKEEFGEERLEFLLEKKGGLDSQSLLNALVQEIDQFSKGMHQTDDLTVFMLRREM